MWAEKEMFRVGRIHFLVAAQKFSRSTAAAACCTLYVLLQTRR
uniref:Uncharacterized protein n=1 Tax=Setaria italica TaxID=4555 RepID=K3ZGK6_SETIT